MTTMRTNNLKAVLKAAVRVFSILPFAAFVALGQQTINLTAGPATATLPDGTTVPMWGYSCGTAATNPLPAATCVPLHPAATAGTWSPVVITVPYVSTGTSLTINLTNNLSFTPAAGGTPNNIPTSITIIGQVGGGLGSSRTTAPSPSHADAQACPTWFIAGA